MTLDTPHGPLYLADSIRELSARRYLLFNQQWAREVGEGCDMYAVDGHLARTGFFLSQQDAASALLEHNNTVLALQNLTADRAQDYRCLLLACLATRRSADTSEAGLQATAAYLAEVLTQAQVLEAVDASKKNFRPN